MTEVEWWGNNSHTVMFDKYVEKYAVTFGLSGQALYEVVVDQFWWLIEMGWTDYHNSWTIKKFPVLQALLKELRERDAYDLEDKYT